MPKLNEISIISKRPTILQLSYGVERANTYVVEENGHAILIDVCSKDAAKEEKEGLDEMLKSEGINIAEGDTVGNIMDMFNAGFSIIEISKVLKISVGEVKAIIDKQQGE